MAKFVAFATKVVAFARSPQGKRDVALVSAAVAAVVSALKQFGVL